MEFLDTANYITPEMEKQTQRLAWMIVLIAFGVFCLICIGSTTGIYYFFFESTVPLDAVLHVGRGTAVITTADLGERGVRGQDAYALVNRPAQISTDSQSQFTLSFYVTDDNQASQLVAAVTLKNTSVFTLRRAIRPRFPWSNGRYEIELFDFAGEMDIVILGVPNRPLLMRVYTQRDELVYLNQSGRYMISANDTYVHTANRAGEAILFSADRESNLLIPTGQEGRIFAGRDPVFYPARVNLLENSLFVFDMPISPQNGETTLPGRWGCANVQAELPRGTYLPGTVDARPALRLKRAEGASANGETRCKQPFASTGKYVGDFNYLELETTFYLNFQSLSECGVEGSECPLMLHLQYVDTNGVPREWYQGFFYNFNPAYDFYKKRCASCMQDHLQVNEKVWYTYESGNLFNVLPAEARPAYITNLEFYASGHQYDTYISDIALYVGFVDAALPEGVVPQMGR